MFVQATEATAFVHTSTSEAAARSARRRSMSGSSFDSVVFQMSPSRDLKKSVHSPLKKDSSVDRLTRASSRPNSPTFEERRRSVSPTVTAAARRARSRSRDQPPQARPRLNSQEQPPSKINTHNKNKNKITATTTTNNSTDSTNSTIDTTTSATFDALDNSLKTYRLSRLSPNANPRVRTQILDQVVSNNNEINNHVQQLLVKQLMNIFATIKHIEMAEHAIKKRKQANTRYDQWEDHPNEGSLSAPPSADHTRLLELYHSQREVALSLGVSSDTIMVAALAVMKELCKTDSIKNLPSNLPKHNPFSETDFQKALARWQQDQPTQAGHVIDPTSYLSGGLYYLSDKKSSSWLPTFSKNTRKWKKIRLFIQQKKLEIYDGNLSENAILSTAVPLFAIEMHNKLVVTPIKVYVNRNNEEKLSFSLIETDDQRTSNGGTKDSRYTTEELIRFSSDYPLQFQFLTVVFQVILNSFH